MPKFISLKFNMRSTKGYVLNLRENKQKTISYSFHALSYSERFLVYLIFPTEAGLFALGHTFTNHKC